MYYDDPFQSSFGGKKYWQLDLVAKPMAESSHVSSMNPWSTQDSLLGMRLGDPQSGLTLARRHGLLGTTSDSQVGPHVMIIYHGRLSQRSNHVP